LKSNEKALESVEKDWEDWKALMGWDCEDFIGICFIINEGFGL